MNSSDLSHPQSSNPEWHLLGELTLSNGSAGTARIQSWLTELLQVWSLQPDFLNRITQSAQDSAARALQPELKLEHIHLTIFGPLASQSAGKDWGFFQIEKLENASETGDSASHSIEFYLYTEGLDRKVQS